MKLKTLAHLIALIGVAAPATAQTSVPTQAMPRVEITGSSIKRIAREGALPIETITRKQLAEQGIVSAEQLIATFQQNASADQIEATPTFIIGGEKVMNQPWDDMKQVIDAKLAEAGSQ